MNKLNFPPLFDKNCQDPNYLRWQSAVLALFEIFKFHYENLGTHPLPKDQQDIHPAYFLKQLKSYVPQEYYFNEKNHAHINSFFGYGNEFTNYPMKESLAIPHLTLEAYQLVWHVPLLYFSNWKETFPLLFSTQNNYLLECCNNVFLDEDKYLEDQPYPIFHSRHKAYFTQNNFEALGLPLSLRLKNFSAPISIPPQIIKTLNFCLRIFQVALLIQSALREIFGGKENKTEQIAYLLQNWDYPNGKSTRGLSLYRLNLLSFLYLNLHAALLVICYGIYRDKYGTVNTDRTALFVKAQGDYIPLKDFLHKQIQDYINLLNAHLLKNKAKEKQLKEKISAALDLARMYGIGYKTESERGTNIHRNAPQDLIPSKVAPSLRNINFRVEHCETSPLWKAYYDYAGEWWSKHELEQILTGKGPEWKKLKNIPRVQAVHLFHKIAAYFWRENLEKTNLPEKTKEHIIRSYQKILK